jgi:Na+/proline symporter
MGNPIFWLYTALFGLGWYAVQRSNADLIIPYSFIGFCIAWALYRLPALREKETLASFFLYERKMPRRQFVGTLVTTNIGFFSSVAFSTILVFAMGIGPAIIAVVAWFIGLIWFSRQIPALMPFFRSGSTIHEFIGEKYGKNISQKRHLRIYSSIITFLLYIASVGAEIKYTSNIFGNLTNIPFYALAGLMALSGVIYVAIAGYRGVVSTDHVRFWTTMLGVGAIYWFLYAMFERDGFSLPSKFLSPLMLTVGPSPLLLMSIVSLLLFYQFCVMDMWERCIAVANSRLVSGRDRDAGVQNDTAAAKKISRMLVWESLVPFILLFGAWYGIGVFAVAQKWTDDANQIIPALFKQLAIYGDANPLSASILETLIVLCFSGAALSTMDGFLIAAVQTVVFDWTQLVSRATAMESDDVSGAKWKLPAARVLTLLLGGVAVAIAFLPFDLLSFWVGMYSLMLSFFPAIYLAIRPAADEPSRPAYRVAASIILGSISALTVAVWGTFVAKDGNVAAIAPFAALAVSGLIIFPKGPLSVTKS